MNTTPISKAPDIGLIIIGDEILSGKRQDKHMAKLIAALSARGLELAWAQYLGDDTPLITATLKRVMTLPDVVFSFGGIGVALDLGFVGDAVVRRARLLRDFADRAPRLLVGHWQEPIEARVLLPHLG